MPSAPPARVTSIIELSTVAGPLAGVRAVPARLEADGVDGAVDLRHAEDLLDLVLRRRPCAESTVSQPKLRACASRSAFRSPTITTAAPSSCAECAAARPTGPAPAT